MPDFDIRFTSGTDSPAWDDRHLSHRGRNVHRYRRFVPPAQPTLGDVVISCVVDGDVAPLDADLDGRLFHVSRLQWSGSTPFVITQAPAQSSLITLSFHDGMMGHQELVIRRDGGGAIILSVEVEPSG